MQAPQLQSGSPTPLTTLAGLHTRAAPVAPCGVRLLNGSVTRDRARHRRADPWAMLYKAFGGGLRADVRENRRSGGDMAFQGKSVEVACWLAGQLKGGRRSQRPGLIRTSSPEIRGTNRRE